MNEVEMPSSSSTTPAETSISHFLVSVKGQIVSGHFPGIDNIYCKYTFSYVDDWIVISGQEESCSQVSRRSIDGRHHESIWNLPIDATFKSTNPFRWPSLVVSVYGVDGFGNDVVRGYSSCHVPTIPGHHEKILAAFVPQSSTLINALAAWFSGKSAEFVSSKVIAQGEGRGVVKVTTQGSVKVDFNVILKDFAKYGYKYR